MTSTRDLLIAEFNLANSGCFKKQWYFQYTCARKASRYSFGQIWTTYCCINLPSNIGLNCLAKMGAFATVIICAVGILVLYLLMLQKGGQTPPGPFGLPLLGYLPFMGSKPHLLLQKLAKIYGPIFR
ncbi:hypothetical protein AVEN_223232-1 [Araneus ventricosus]|uniref:Cytochrome P450 18a1 n=1 Tax=Araneus ventricosus TaxID=182803 RepID=A0A4Y2JEA4_ARAVE|nr:hypothetical protein AVEN_223232-1 [Araneus ventricosus]